MVDSTAPSRTTHLIGLPGQRDQQSLPPAAVVLIDERPDGIFLIRFATDGRFGGDTWHRTVEEAKRQAGAEYEASLGNWRPFAVPGLDLAEAVSSSANEDWQGLWEPLWWFQGVAPDLPTTVAATLVEDVLLQLHRQGWIELVRVARDWPTSPDLSDPRLTGDAAQAAIRGEGWRVLPPDTTVWFTASPAGERAWRLRQVE